MEKEVTNSPRLENTEKHEGPSRREFLSGGTVLAVAATSLLGGRALSQTSGTLSAERAAKEPQAPVKAAAQTTAKSTKKYQHLLSPMKIGNHVLKNRIIGTPSSPHFLVSPESYPNDALIDHYVNKARAGAALVVLSQSFGIHPTFDGNVLNVSTEQTDQANQDHSALGEGFTLNLGQMEAMNFTLQTGSVSEFVEIKDNHFPAFDLANAGCQNILSQLTQAVHFYGSLCLWKGDMRMPTGYDVSAGNPFEDAFAFGEKTWANMSGAVKKGAAPGQQGSTFSHERKEITEEMLQKVINDVVLQAVLGKQCGFDGIFLHCAYRAAVTARLLSPMTNRRTDKYGGSLENRARFTIELTDAIKKRCGQDFFIMAIISGREPEGGYTLDDGAEYAKLFTGHIDLLDLKGDPGEKDSQPSYFILEHTPFLYMTEGYKKRGVTIPLLSDGGFTNLDWAEEALASGKTDAIGMARAFITTPDLGRLAFEGRNEDVVPCLRCNACNGWGFFKPWNSTCTVNPVYGLEHKINKMISPPQDKKKVAVIGGGPAGMEAALVASRRGHAVTLYEKTGSLGGNLKANENVSFRWTYKDFKDYLVRQTAKSGVKVRLNTKADPAMIKNGGYDAVIVAMGSEPIVPDIPGIKGKNVVFAQDVYGKEDSLAADVVIIGGAEAGVVTGMHLAQKGHQVTVVEASDWLAREDVRIHFYSAFQEAWGKLPNFKFVLQARCNEITKDGVTYIDAEGKQKSLKAGSVVVAMGMKAKTDLAFKFNETSNRFYVVGDCAVAGDLQNAMWTAFSTASTI